MTGGPSFRTAQRVNAVTGGTWKPGVLHFGHPAPAEVDRHELEDTHVCFLCMERLHADGLLHVGRSHPMCHDQMTCPRSSFSTMTAFPSLMVSLGTANEMVPRPGSAW